MINDLQKASLMKRFMAFLLDLILLVILVTGFMWILSSVTNYDSYSNAMSDKIAEIKESYGVLAITEEYEIDLLGAKFRQKAFLITFANSSQWGNNVFIAPDANISDGMMDVVIWRSSPMVTMPLITAELFLRKIKYSEFVDTYRCKEVVVRRKGKGVVQFDGESIEMGEEIRVSVQHNALEVIVPSALPFFV